MHLRIFPLLCLLASAAAAEPLTPEAAARLALDNHPGLAAARLVIAETEARASGLGRLPNPELAAEFAAGARSRGRLELGLSQRFPHTARLRLERSVANEVVALARLEVAVREAEIAELARTTTLDLVAARAHLALAEQQAVLAREFAETRARLVEEGQLSALDASQARFTAREADLALAELRAAETTAAAALATVLGRESDRPLEVAADLGLPATSPEVLAAGPRPDLTAAARAVTVGEAKLALARRAGHEDRVAGLFVETDQERDPFGQREREVLVGLRLSLPLPVRAVAAPAVAEKQAARRRLTLERDSLALAARNEAAATGAALRARHATALALASELLPAARAHLAATNAAQARGEVDSVLLFRAREQLAAIERADLAARHAYHLAHIRHLAATGHLLAQP